MLGLEKQVHKLVLGQSHGSMSPIAFEVEKIFHLSLACLRKKGQEPWDRGEVAVLS